MRKRIVVAVTGASGSIYGYRLLQKLREKENIQIHLVIEPGGRTNIQA